MRVDLIAQGGRRWKWIFEFCTKEANGGPPTADTWNTPKKVYFLHFPSLSVPVQMFLKNSIELELLDWPVLDVSVWPLRWVSPGQDGSRVGAFGWEMRIWLPVSWVVGLQWVEGTIQGIYGSLKEKRTRMIYPRLKQRKSKDNLY